MHTEFVTAAKCSTDWMNPRPADVLTVLGVIVGEVELSHVVDELEKVLARVASRNQGPNVAEELVGGDGKMTFCVVWVWLVVEDCAGLGALTHRV